jgi:outer membrane protein assembly factor BamA
LILVCSVTANVAAQRPEVVAQIQVQGNTITPDAEMLDLAGLSVGMPLAPETIDSARRRLDATGRFDRVQVLKRFASITDASQIVLVVIVHEPGASIALPGAPGLPARVVRRRGPGLQYLPLLDYDDGYGWTYGLQLALPRPAGDRSRIAFPLTWGGERKAAAVFEKTFPAGPLTRVESGGSLTRRVQPYFEEPENRARVWVRAERAFGLALRTGMTADWQRVGLGPGPRDEVASIGADATVDTRIDPWLARNAVWVHASWMRAAFPGAAANLTELDARGYLGLPGQSVLVARVARRGADTPVPGYAKRILGGLDTLRGFRVGTAVGDTLALGSLEVRTPFTSPLRIAKMGVSAFVDAAAAYDAGERLGDRIFSRGIGGGVWMSLPVARLELSVAHGLGASTRVQFGLTVGH